MSNVRDQIDAVDRTVVLRSQKHAQANALVLSRVYDTTVNDLWDACTDRERIGRWLRPISGELRVGGRYQVEGNASGTVETCEPPHRFTASWEYEGAVSWIVASLSQESPQRTRLTLEQIVPDDEKWRRFGPGAIGVGWDLSLAALATDVSRKSLASEPDATAHEQSAGGKPFVILSSSSWMDANVAAGTDPNQATTAAAATTAFYTASREEAH
jgi:uncharacterized protein YndB with AHSA1/START domain